MIRPMKSKGLKLVAESSHRRVRVTPRWTILASVLALVVASLAAVMSTAQVDPSARPIQVAPALTPRVLSGDNLRVIPPSPTVRITPLEESEVDTAQPLRSTLTDRPAQEALEAARERRNARIAERRESRSERAEPADEPDRPSTSAPRGPSRVRTAQAEAEEPSGRSDGSMRYAPEGSSQRSRRGQQRERDYEYGRLIIVTNFEDDVRATVDGEPYPYASLDGVLLIAGYQYDVVIERADSASASASTESSNFRTIPVRLQPGETRVLMASLSDSSSGVRAARDTSSRRSSARSRNTDREEDEDEEEEIGYLGVSSTPTGTIWIDGDNIGQTTPARRIELEPGRHEVRIFYDSEDEFSETKNVLIRAGVNTNVFFRMRRNRDADDEE